MDFVYFISSFLIGIACGIGLYAGLNRNASNKQLKQKLLVTQSQLNQLSEETTEHIHKISDLLEQTNHSFNKLNQEWLTQTENLRESQTMPLAIPNETIVSNLDTWQTPPKDWVKGSQQIIKAEKEKVFTNE